MISIVMGNTIYADLIRYLVVLCTFIPFWVFIALAWNSITGCDFSSLENENNLIEWAWTVIPSGLVGYLCILNSLCMTGGLAVKIDSVIKVVGRQWYWSYEMPGFQNNYDSLMLDFINSVDKPLWVGKGIYYHLLVTSADVIHSFAIPELNIKMDAVPGRINQCILRSDKLGVSVGYCSELCGAGHAFMPIVVETLLLDPKFYAWGFKSK